MVSIKAVLFDMDGVLIEAKDWHYDALNKALGLFGMEISRYDHLVTYDGLPTKRKLDMLTMERGLANDYLDFYISNQDVKKGKPDPEMYNTAIKRLDLQPEECMIIEDNEKGLQAARASKAFVMEVDTVDDANYQNIMDHIRRFENEEG